MFLYERAMQWKGGQVPISEPACGFDGSKCQLKFGTLPVIIYTNTKQYAFKNSGRLEYRFQTTIYALLISVYADFGAVGPTVQLHSLLEYY